VASIVHQRVDTPELREGGVDGRLDRLGVLDVEARDQHALGLRELGLLIRRSHCRDDIPALRVEVLGRGRPRPLDVPVMRMVLFVWCSFLNTNVRSSGIVYTGGLRHSAIRLRQGISADNTNR
jgi:hypothetical protein